MKKAVKKIIAFLSKHLYVLPFILLAAIIPFAISYSKAESVGEAIGAELGSFAGKVNGTIHGIEPGKTDGHNDALKAEDTTTEIKNSIEEVGKLQILKADVSLTNENSIGDDYKALYILRGTATFTVDLEQCRIEETDNIITITVPAPESEIRIDENKTQKFAESQKYRWSGSTEDGYIAYINTGKQVVSATKEAIHNYSVLEDNARSSAKRTVQLLAENINIPDPNTNTKAKIIVKIAEEVSEDDGN